MKKILTFLSIAAVLAVVVFILLANRRSSREKIQLVSEISSSVRVQAAVVTGSELSTGFVSNGVVQPVSELSFISDVSGRVVRVLAEEGMHVSKGQVLLETDDELLQADFRSAEAAYLGLKADLERFKNAFSEGGVTSQQLQTIQTQYVAAESRYLISKRRLDDSRVKAPISGIINRKYVDNGTLLNPGSRLFDIVDPTRLHIWCNVTEREMLMLKKGDQVRIESRALGNRSFSGRVNFISLTSDRSLSYPVEVIPEGKDSEELMPGMFATVYFNAGMGEQEI
ncbi:MAG: efflux RND transporter periplasmic adaptor subunit, partial [Bacteroidota bacterium]